MEELLKLHEAVSKDFDIGDFESFKAKMNSSGARKRFYDKIGGEGLDLGNYDDYEARLSGGTPKKAKADGSVESESLSAGLENSSSDSNKKLVDKIDDGEITPEVNPDPDGILDSLPDGGLEARHKAIRKLQETYNRMGIEDFNISDDDVVTEAIRSLDTKRFKKMADTIDKLNKTDNPKKQRSYWSNLLTNLKVGSTELGTMIASIPETVYNISALPQNGFAALTGLDTEASASKFKENRDITNPILDFYVEENEQLKEKVNEFNKKYETTSVYENITKGNYGDAFELLGSGIVQSAPVSVSMMVGGAATSVPKLAGYGTVAMTGAKRLEIDAANPELSELDKTIKSLGLAGAETVFAAVSQGTMGKVYKDIILKEGADAGKVIFKEGLVKMYETALKKHGAVAGALGEGIEEVATTITQNMINGDDAFQGVADSFIQGVAGGVLYGSPITINNAANKIQEGYDKRQVNKILEDDTNSYKKVSDAFLPESTSITAGKLDLVEQKGSLKMMEKELDAQVKEGEITEQRAEDIKKDFLDTTLTVSKTKGIELSKESRVKAVRLIKEKEQLKAEIKVMDDALATSKKERVLKIDENLAALVGADKAKTKADKAEASLPKPQVKAKVSKPVTNQKELETTLKDDNWGMLTGENPNATQQTEEQNTEANKRAIKWLKDKGYSPQEISGTYGKNKENSFLVPNLTKKDAIDFAKEFDQESVATNEGYIFQDGSMHPRVDGDSVGGKYDDNYSTINTPEGDVSFQVNYDWDNKIAAKRTGYRAGDLKNKAEKGGKFDNYRSTGHFGTGFYFFGEKQTASDYAESTGGREVSEIGDLDNYNLAKGTKPLHKSLKSLNDEALDNGKISQYSLVSVMNESKAQFDRKENPFEKPARNNKEHKALLAKGLTETEIAKRDEDFFDWERNNDPYKKLVEDVNKKLADPSNEDTASTLVMKALGFDGVDSTGTDLDNAVYGSVIYDIKTNESNKQENKPLPETEGGKGNDQEGTDSSPTGDVQASKGISEEADKMADNIRKLKINSSVKESMSKLNSRPTAAFEMAWDTAIEIVADTVSLTGNVAQAVVDGVQALKDSTWYKGLSKEGRAKAERMFREDLDRQFDTKETYNPSFQESIKASFNKLKENTIQKFVDKFHILRKATENNFDTSDDANNFSQAEINMHGKAAHDLDVFRDEMEVIVREVADKGLSNDEFSDYLYAKHAKERNAHIRDNIDAENEFGSGMTDKEADTILNDRFTDEQIEALEELSAKIYKVTQGTRDMMLDFGLITEEQYNGLVGYYENYVPLKGFENEVIDAVENIQGSRLDVQGNQLKRAGGRSTRADNVLANVISERVGMNMKARKNEVLQTLYNLAEGNTANGVMQLFDKSNLPTKMVVDADGKRVKQPERPDAREDYVGVKVEGKQFYLKFANKELGRVLNGANVEKADVVTKALRTINRYLSATLTSLDPRFVISNFARDIQTAVFNVTAEADINAALKGQNIAKAVVKDVGKSIRAIYGNERAGKTDTDFQKYYEEFKADGAKTGWANQNNLADIKKKLDRIHDMSTKKTLIGGLKNLGEFVNDVNTSVENGVRLSAYVNGRKAGMTRPQASMMAKELTVNFNKSGEYGTVANSLYLFFNAAIQGNVRFIKAMTTLKKTIQPDGTTKKSLNRGQKMALSMMGFASLVTMLNQSLSDDDEDGQSFYSKIPDFEKERNLIFMNPVNGKDYFKIPLPYGYNIFHNVGMVATEVSTGERPVGDALGFLTSSAVGAFSPVSFGHSDNAAGVIGSAVIPTIVKPIWDLHANEDYFGSQIYNENFPFGVPKPDSDMGRPSTPEAFKMTTKLLNEMSGGNDFESGALDFAPESMYYLFKFAVGGTGKFLMQTGESIGTAVDAAQGEKPDLEVRKLPFVSKVYAEPNDYVDQTNYFKRFEKIQQRELAIKDRRQKGEMTQKDKKDYSKVAAVVKRYEAANKKLSELRKKKRAANDIENSIERAKKLKILNEKYFELIKKTNGEYNKKLGINYE